MEETKKKLYVERDGFWTEAAMVFTALAMVFRLIGSIGRWNDLQYLTTQVALPIFCGLLFLLCLLLFGKRAFWTTVLPVVIGVVFFIFRAMRMENEWLRGCWIIVYLVFTVLYTMAFSCPKLKWALVLLLLAVFAYHIGVQDLPKLMDLEHPVSFVDGMEEMSVLGIVLAMLFVSLAMRSTPKVQKAKEETGTLPENEVRQDVELQPETQPWPAPGEEPLSDRVPEEKKLSRREKRRLEKQRKQEEKLLAQNKPAALLEMEQAVDQTPLDPVQPEASAAVTWQQENYQDPSWQQEAPQESLWQQPEQALQETDSAAPAPESEIPMEELGFRAEPATAYPLEETQSPDTNEPDSEGSSQML